MSRPDRQIGRWIYADRAGHVLFIKPDDSVEYPRVIQVMDAARCAGVSVLGAVL